MLFPKKAVVQVSTVKYSLSIKKIWEREKSLEWKITDSAFNLNKTVLIKGVSTTVVDINIHLSMSALYLQKHSIQLFLHLS